MIGKVSHRKKIGNIEEEAKLARLCGKIPTGIGNLTELINLEFSDNFISGEILSEIGKLQNLWQLEMYNNSFTGKLPYGLRNLTKLELFDASMNNLAGNQIFASQNLLSGEIPEEISKATSLVTIKFLGKFQQVWAKTRF
ncbi:hypothetical protein K1719_013553 [Acacia pycnantha]|nr:hypothetical protein K1719_013553 [Acacia pycnantha]